MKLLALPFILTLILSSCALLDDGNSGDFWSDINTDVEIGNTLSRYPESAKHLPMLVGIGQANPNVTDMAIALDEYVLTLPKREQFGAQTLADAIILRYEGFGQ